MAGELDCVVCGSCVADLLCRPVPLDRPIGAGVLTSVEPITLAGGGITSNAGVTMARLGLRVAVLSHVGEDVWGSVVRDLLHRAGLDVTLLTTLPGAATSTTVVLVGPDGERSLLHCVGAPRRLAPAAIYDRLGAIARARFFLLGYFGLMPGLEPELHEVLRRVRETGCRVAMDAAGTSGTMDALRRVLPHVDVWVPSLAEARTHTGLDGAEPQRMIAAYRSAGAHGIVGVKLGPRGVLIAAPDQSAPVLIPAAPAPGPVVDTTGAGDSFYAGLIAGLVKGFTVEQAARLGVAASACCITTMGGSTGGRDFATTARIAGLA